MFWKFNQSSPQLDTILAKEDLTLDELFDQESLLQELKSQNQNLIEFIIRREVLDQLVTFIIEEPGSDMSDTEKYKRANLSCEVLTTDIPRVNESLANEGLLTKLFSFLEKEPPLNPLLASFFSRTMSLLICRKADQHWYSYQFTCLSVLDFFKTRNHSLDLLLKHLGTSAIMDLTLKLVTQIEGDEMQQTLNDWLESEQFLSNVIDLFDPSVDADRHYNAAQLLHQIIRKSRETSINKPDPLLSNLQSTATIQILLKHMLNEDSVSESSINCGITVLLTLLEDPVPETTSRRGPYYDCYDESISGENNQPLVNPALPTIVSAIIPSLPKFHDLLINPPKKNPVKLACGTIEPPLGTIRLSVIKLMSALIATNTPEVNEMLDSLNVIQVLLDLFFHYTWNNFLHTQVDKCLAFALNCPVNEVTENNPLLINIFIKCRLIHRILDAWKDNSNEESKEGGKRRGYMGHLTNIANTILKQFEGSLGDFLKQHVDEETLNSWQEYVDNSLKPTNELHGRVLGGKHPGHNSREGSNSDFTTVPYYNVPFEQILQNYANETGNEPTLNSGRDQVSIGGLTEGELEAWLEAPVSREEDEDDLVIPSFFESRMQRRTFVRDRIAELRRAEDLDDEPPPEYKTAAEIEASYYKNDSNPWAECANAEGNDESWANFDTASFESQFTQNLTIDAATTSEPPLKSCEEKNIESEPSDVTTGEVSPTISQPTAQVLSPIDVKEKMADEGDKLDSNEIVAENEIDKANVSIESVVAETPCGNQVLEVKGTLETTPDDSKDDFGKVAIVENDNKPIVLNNVGNEISMPDSELVDNYRFLSKQGMITNESDSSKTEDSPDTLEKNERTSEVPREGSNQVDVEAAPNPV